MNTKMKICATLLFVCFYFSCDHGTDNGKQSFETSNLVPVAVGNYWIYTDSAQVQNDTVSVINVRYENRFTWWTLKNTSFACADLGDEFAVSRDTILKSVVIRGRSIYKTLILPWFIPLKDSSVVFTRFYGDYLKIVRVTMFKRSYTVPAGTFDQHISYVLDSGSEKDSLVIVPQVGIVARILERREYPGGPVFSVKSYLKNYRVFH